MTKPDRTKSWTMSDGIICYEPKIFSLVLRESGEEPAPEEKGAFMGIPIAMEARSPSRKSSRKPSRFILEWGTGAIGVW